MLMRAVEAASDALFHRHTSKDTTKDTSNDTAEEIEPKQRRADALGLLAERALAMGFGRGEGAEAEDVENADEKVAVGHEGAGKAQGVADAEGEGTADGKAGAYTTPLSGSRAERYQVVLHVEAATLESEREPGCSELEDGTRLSAEVGIHFTLLATTGCAFQRGADGRERRPSGPPAARGDRRAAPGPSTFVC